MSKKKNKKFKKTTVASHSTVSAVGENVSNMQTLSTEKNNQPVIAAEKDNDPYAISILNKKYLHVRKDVKKLLITISILVICLIGAYILGAQTSVLSTIGDWLYKLGNFAV